jgi:hypothetical protein
MSDVGKAISASFAFVSEVGKECEALANLIKGEISALFSKDPLIALYKPGEWSSSYRTDESGWVFSAAAWTLPLTPKGKRKATAHLAFQITFLCNDAAGGFSPEPLIHVNLWDDPTDVRYDNYMGFEMRDISPRSLARFQEGTASLFRWETENGAADRWTFSLRLAQINSLDDIRDQICKLIRSLLIDVDEGEAAVHETSGVIRWSADDTIPDHYRIVR